MAITNRQIAKAFRLASQLMELHSENPFKVRSLQNAAFKIEKLSVPLSSQNEIEIASIEGIGKGLQAKISDYLKRESFSDLDDLVSRTPSGVIDVLGIKGIGPKKVLQLWKELEIESVGELLYACNENRLVSLKGFGEKTQKLIRESIEFRISNAHNCLFPIAEFVSDEIIIKIKFSSPDIEIFLTGQARRKCEIITSIEFISSINESELKLFLSGSELFYLSLPVLKSTWKLLSQITSLMFWRFLIQKHPFTSRWISPILSLNFVKENLNLILHKRMDYRHSLKRKT